MLEGDHGKLAAPAQRQRDAAEDAEDVVAASLGAVSTRSPCCGRHQVPPARPRRTPVLKIILKKRAEIYWGNN